MANSLVDKIQINSPVDSQEVWVNSLVDKIQINSPVGSQEGIQVVPVVQMKVKVETKKDLEALGLADLVDPVVTVVMVFMEDTKVKENTMADKFPMRVEDLVDLAASAALAALAWTNSLNLERTSSPSSMANFLLLLLLHSLMEAISF